MTTSHIDPITQKLGASTGCTLFYFFMMRAFQVLVLAVLVASSAATTTPTTTPPPTTAAPIYSGYFCTTLPIPTTTVATTAATTVATTAATTVATTAPTTAPTTVATTAPTTVATTAPTTVATTAPTTVATTAATTVATTAATTVPTTAATTALQDLEQCVTVTTNLNTDVATITMTGPADRWFGFGFGSNTMSGTYAIYTGAAVGTNSSSTLIQQRLGNSASGIPGAMGTQISSAANPLKILTDSSSGRTRTIQFTRPITTSEHSFATTSTLPFNMSMITARAKNPSFALQFHGKQNMQGKMQALSYNQFTGTATSEEVTLVINGNLPAAAADQAALANKVKISIAAVAMVPMVSIRNFMLKAGSIVATFNIAATDAGTANSLVAYLKTNEAELSKAVLANTGLTVSSISTPTTAPPPTTPVPIGTTAGATSVAAAWTVVLACVVAAMAAF